MRIVAARVRACAQTVGESHRLHPFGGKRRAGRGFGAAVVALRAGERRRGRAARRGGGDRRLRPRSSPVVRRSPARGATIPPRSPSTGCSRAVTIISASSPPTARSRRSAAPAPCPATGQRPWRAAIFSCSNIGYGWFNAYGHAAARDDFDCVIHLGDYFYEYAPDHYPPAKDTVPGRLPAASGQRRSISPTIACATPAIAPIPTCRHCTLKLPMIAQWDDHESANDSYEAGCREPPSRYRRRLEPAQAPPRSRSIASGCRSPTSRGRRTTSAGWRRCSAPRPGC